jgi:hypothetical protein
MYIVLPLGENAKQYAASLQPDDDPDFIPRVIAEVDRMRPFPNHQKNCPRQRGWTHHDSFSRWHRPASGTPEPMRIHRVRCLDCGAVVSVFPSFIFPYQHRNTDSIQNNLENLLLHNNSLRSARAIYNQDQKQAPIADEQTLCHMVRLIGEVPIAKLLIELGLAPPRHVVEDEKFLNQAGTRSYALGIVEHQKLLIWWLDYLLASDEAAITASLAEFKSLLGGKLPEGFTLDGWQATRLAIRALFPQARIQDCLLHARQALDRTLAAYQKHERAGDAQVREMKKEATELILEAKNSTEFAAGFQRLTSDWHVQPDLKKRLARWQQKAEELTAWTVDALMAKTSSLLDVVLKQLERKTASMQTFRVVNGGRVWLNAWGLVRNFKRFGRGAQRAGQSPVELAGLRLQGLPWLQFLLVRCQFIL